MTEMVQLRLQYTTFVISLSFTFAPPPLTCQRCPQSLFAAQSDDMSQSAARAFPPPVGVGRTRGQCQEQRGKHTNTLPHTLENTHTSSELCISADL